MEKGPRSREQGAPLAGIAKEASTVRQNKRISHGALTGRVVQRGLKLIHAFAVDDKL